MVVKGKDIFTDKEYECSFSSGEKVDAPIVKTSEYIVVNIEDDNLELLDEKEGDIKSNVKLP